MASMTTTLFAFLALLVFAHAQTTVRTINVSGTGVATAPPDLATINTGVVTMAKTAEEALDANNKAAAAILETLKTKGIKPEDIQTTFFNVNPQFERSESGERGALIGYRVSNELSVKVRNLDILGEVLDALVTAGSNRISGVNFSIADTKPISKIARRRAVAEAKSRAQLYARAGGVTLGKIISISDTPISQPSAFGGRLAAESADFAEVPIATGELDVSATVFILFEISG